MLEAIPEFQEWLFHFYIKAWNVPEIKKLLLELSDIKGLRGSRHQTRDF
ncbi:hypothetical protein AQPE_2087 [Aquipluma nitroreducens]|uniref:Uncharacterized protein n=1 Tax=Aquipluma nitroreducens TaxID=2010828 RepID=A0A5K7S8P3_9BACT|nr:hypothetical protein AQPE_2087 [Aquipluma nitroreducens]